MVDFINASQTWGIILASGTDYTTGSIFLTLSILLVFLMAMAILFGIRLEYTAILILPLMLSYMAFYSEFLAIGSLILIYLALIFTKKFLFK